MVSSVVMLMSDCRSSKIVWREVLGFNEGIHFLLLLSKKEHDLKLFIDLPTTVDGGGRKKTERAA